LDGGEVCGGGKEREKEERPAEEERACEKGKTCYIVLEGEEVNSLNRDNPRVSIKLGGLFI